MHYGVIPAGTEGMKLRDGKRSYVGKARARPDKLKQMFSSRQQQGLLATYRRGANKLDTLTRRESGQRSAHWEIGSIERWHIVAKAEGVRRWLGATS
jgi:hypothetical protein